MSADRIGRLRRVLGVRAHFERASEAACARAAAEAAVAQAAVNAAEGAAALATQEYLSGLAAGEAAGCVLALAMRGVAVRHGERMQLAAQTSAKALADRQREWKHTRLQREQCEAMLVRVRQAATAESMKREQANSDDRFAARRHWTAL